MEIPQAVSDTRSEAARLGKVASDYAGAEYTIPDQLKKVVQEALDYNKDIVGMRSQALADYQAAPSAANARFGVQQFGAGERAGQANPDFIFNPFERNAAIQGFIQNQSVPFSIANTLLGMREGTAADVIGAGTRAFQSQSAAAQAAAAAARQTYQDVLNEFTTTTQLNQRQQEIDLSKSKAGGGDDATAALFSRLEQILGGGQEQQGIDLSAFIEEDQPQKSSKKSLPPVNLKGVTKTAQLSPGMSGTVVNAPTQQGNNGEWFLQPAINAFNNWAQGWNVPQQNYMKLQ